jgi:hypothetical protein
LYVTLGKSASIPFGSNSNAFRNSSAISADIGAAGGRVGEAGLVFGVFVFGLEAKFNRSSACCRTVAMRETERGKDDLILSVRGYVPVSGSYEPNQAEELGRQRSTLALSL